MAKLSKANRAVNLFISFAIILFWVVLGIFVDMLVGFKKGDISTISELLHNAFWALGGAGCFYFLRNAIKGYT